MKLFHKIKLLSTSDNLLGRCMRGGSVLSAGSLVENIFRFIRNIILARLLAPEAFGLMATVMAAVAAMEAFAEVGLKQSVIQNKNGAANDFLCIIWWLSVIRGLILYLIAYFASPWLCSFYGNSELLNILRVGFTVLLFTGLINPKLYVLEKEFRFSRWVLIMQGSGVLGTLAAILLAFFLHNVWALVLGYVLEAVLRCLLSFILNPFLPKIIINRAYLTDILDYSRRIFGLPILTMLFFQTDVFVIGKVLTLNKLGLYTLARDLAIMPNTFLTKIIQPLVLPAFSELQDDKEKLKHALLTVTRVIATFGIPFIAFMIVFSKPILTVIYGIQYASVFVPFSIFCIYALVFLCSTFIMNIFLAIGKPDLQRTASLFRTILFIIIIYPATKGFGLTGSSCAMLLAMCSSLTLQIIYLNRLINISIYEYVRNFTQGILLSLIVIIPGIFQRLFFINEGFISMLVGISFCIAAWCVGIYKIRSLEVTVS